jgi:hypothetical protein
MKSLILTVWMIVSLGVVSAQAAYQPPAQNYQQSSWING